MSKLTLGLLFFLLFQTDLIAQPLTLDSLVEVIEISRSDDSQTLEDQLEPYLQKVKTEKQVDLWLYLLSELIYEERAYILPSSDLVVEADSLLNCCIQELMLKDQDSAIFYTYLESKSKYLYEIEDYTNALRLYKILINNTEIYDEIDSLYQAFRYSELGNLYLRIGNPDRALLYYQEYLNYLPSVYDYPDDAIFYEILGYSYLAGSWKMKGIYRQNDIDLSNAVRFYRKAISLIDELEQPTAFSNTITSAYYGLIDIYQEAENYDSAVFYLNEARQYNLQASPKMKARILRLEGEQLLAESNVNAALEYFNKAKLLHVRQKGENHLDSYVYNNYIATALAENGDIQSALDLVQKNLQILGPDSIVVSNIQNPRKEAIVFLPEAIHTLNLKSDLLSKLYYQYPSPENWQNCIATYRLAVELSLKERSISFGTDAKQRYIHRHRKLIESALDFCFETKEKVKDVGLDNHVLWFMENSKALLLQEELNHSQAFKALNVPVSIIELLDSLKKSRNVLSEKLREDYTSIALLKDIKNVEETYDSIQQLLGARFPGYLAPSSFKFSLKDHQSNVEENRNVLNYFQGGSSYYLLSINSRNIEFIRIEDRDRITQAIDTVLDMSRKRTLEPDKFSANLQYLFEALIGPVDNMLTKCDAITVIPDGYLSYLPFEMLLSGEPADDAYQDWPYLLKNYAFSYEYSLQLSDMMDVKDSDASQSYLGIAPEYSSGSPKDLMVMTGDSMLLAERDFGELMFNKNEVVQVYDIFGGQTLLDTEATRENFLRHVTEAKLIHLSMHAYVDEANPDQSGLVFSDFREENQGISKNGFIAISELSTLKLNAEMVMLSACETGYGYLERGEGPLSLGRAFKMAGCPTSAMSIWKANDYSTSQIMISYAQYLADGEEKDKALQLAKLDYLANADRNTSHPYFWASFILHGDNAPLSFVKGRTLSRTWVYILCSLFFIIAIYYVRMKRKT